MPPFLVAEKSVPGRARDKSISSHFLADLIIDYELTNCSPINDCHPPNQRPLFDRRVRVQQMMEETEEEILSAGINFRIHIQRIIEYGA